MDLDDSAHDNILLRRLVCSRASPDAVPMAEWLQAYKSLEIAACSSRHTARARTDDSRDFLAAFESETLGGTPGRPVGDWTRPITIAYLHRFERKPATAKRRFSTLRSLSKFVRRHCSSAFPSGDPTQGIRWPQSPEPEWKGLSEDEVRRLRAGAEDRVLICRGRVDIPGKGAKHRHAIRDAAMFEVLLGTALRVGELCSLDLEQYECPHLRRVRRKGASYQDILVPTRARSVLEEYLHRRGPVPGPLFLSRRGRRLDRSAVTRALKAIAAQAGHPPIELHPHLLRHTALRAISRRASLEAAIRLSGHSPSSGARYVVRYTASSQEELERAQEEVLG